MAIGNKEVTKAVVDGIIQRHRKFLNGEDGGERAVFDGMNLDGWDFGNADLRKAEFRNTSLAMASFRNSRLGGTLFHGCVASGADMRNANLREAKVVVSDFSLCIFNLAALDGAVFRDSTLVYSSFVGASLGGVVLDRSDVKLSNFSGAWFPGAGMRLGTVLRRKMRGWKVSREGIVFEVEIPKGAVVFSINGGKCRSNIGKVVKFPKGSPKVLHSIFSRNFTYREGQTVEVPDFCPRYNVECAKGFHFFRTKKEATAYRLESFGGSGRRDHGKGDGA